MFLCVFCACIRFYINVNLKNNISKVKCALGHPMPPFRPTHSDYVNRSSAHTCVYFKFRWFDSCGSYGNAFFYN